MAVVVPAGIGVELFVSFTEADRPWAERTGWQLEDAGYRVLLKAGDVIGGAPLIAEIDRAVSAAATYRSLTVAPRPTWTTGARRLRRLIVADSRRPADRPARAFVGGQGLREVSGGGGGAGAQLRRMAAGWGTGAPGSEQERSERRARESGLDPVAIVHVLDSLVVTPAQLVGGVEVPTLVVVGREDPRAVSAAELVDALPAATLVEVAGDHGTAPAAPELATAVGRFLAGRPAGR